MFDLPEGWYLVELFNKKEFDSDPDNYECMIRRPMVMVIVQSGDTPEQALTKCRSEAEIFNKRLGL
jgi:hypothetical protein